MKVHKKGLAIFRLLNIINHGAFMILLIVLWFATKNWLILFAVGVPAAIIFGTFLACWKITAQIVEDLYVNHMDSKE